MYRTELKKVHHQNSKFVVLTQNCGSNRMLFRAVPEINLWGGGRQKEFFRLVEVLFITDFRRLGGERNYVFRWVVGLFSVLFIQNKKLLENGSKCPFSCLNFYTSYLYVCRFCLSATSTNGVSFLVPLQNNSILG